MAVNLDEVVTTLSGLTVLEASELVKKLEDKWGVSAAAPVAVAAAAPAATLARLIQEPGARVARVIRSKPEAAAA